MNRRSVLKSVAALPLAFAFPVDVFASEEHARMERIREHLEYSKRFNLNIWYSETEFVLAEDAVHAAQIYRELLYGPDHFQNGFVPVEPSVERQWRGLGTYEPLDGELPEHWNMWPSDKLFPFTEELAETDSGFGDPDPLRIQGTAPHFLEAYVRRDKHGRLPDTGDAVVIYEIDKDDRIWVKTTKKLPREWAQLLGVGYMGTTER